jgi:hypothetical protein
VSTLYWYQGDSTAERVYQVRLGEVSGLPTDSRLGQSATGGLVVDDPDGTLVFRTWRRFWAEDDEAPSGDQRLWAGYITHISVNHGPNRTPTGRVWNLTLTDMNSILHHRKIRPTDTGHSRPAETDIERLTWLLATDWADGVLFTDLGLVDTTGPVGVDAEDLAGKYFGDVLADLSNASGKNHCLVPHEAEDHRDLVYASNGSALYPSTIAISNVLSDVDWDTVFPPGTPGEEFPDATLEIDGEKDYDGAYVTYKSGAFYRTSIADPGEVFRDTDIDLPEASNLTTAETTADRELADLDAPDEEISVSLFMSKTHVTLVKPWHRLLVRFSHLPEYENWRPTRIVSHAFRQDAPGATDDWYRVDLGLSPLPPEPPHFLLMLTAGLSGITDNSAHPWTAARAHASFANDGQFPGPGGGWMGLYYRAIVPNESADVAAIVVGGQLTGIWVLEVAGIDPSTVAVATSGSDDFDSSHQSPPGTMIPGYGISTIGATAAVESVLVGAMSFQKVGYGQVTQIEATAGTEIFQANANNEDGRDYSPGDGDACPPYSWFGYATGTGALEMGGWLHYPGAAYNLMGRAFCALMFDKTGTFSVVQSAFNGGAFGSTVVVTLPSPPTP